jgi:hypothetical protein
MRATSRERERAWGKTRTLRIITAANISSSSSRRALDLVSFSC